MEPTISALERYIPLRRTSSPSSAKLFITANQPRKEDAKSIIGTAGVQEILSALALSYSSLPTVCIGGINTLNAQRIFYQCHAPSKRLDGIAVVSAIVAAKDPAEAASNLKALVTNPPPFGSAEQPRPVSADELINLVPAIVKNVSDKNPLCHNMTNLVVQNLAANVALCM
jgi:thiamine-phosphate diphosphorylase / hydroxyethylthiazole kinase